MTPITVTLPSDQLTTHEYIQAFIRAIQLEANAQGIELSDEHIRGVVCLEIHKAQPTRDNPKSVTVTIDCTTAHLREQFVALPQDFLYAVLDQTFKERL